MEIRHADFSSGRVSSLIVSVSLPLILAELVNLLYSMVDRIYIGHIPEVGSTALTGLGLCFPIISLISAFARLFGFNGGAPLCSIALGRKDMAEAEKVLGSSFLMAVLTGAVTMVLTIVFMNPVLHAFGASENTYPYARDYLAIYALGSIPVLITLSMNAFINGQGYAKVGMTTVIVGAVLNILLDPLFIFVFSLGVKGAAIATVISQCASAVLVLTFLTGKSTEIRLKISCMKLEPARCMRIIALGTSGFVMGATNSIVQIVCNKMAFIWGGDLYVGVMTILNSVRDIFSTPVNGIGNGASPVMSFNYGAKDGGRTRRASDFTLVFGVVVSLLIWLIVQFFPYQLAHLFTQDDAMLQASARALRIYFFGFVFMAFQIAGQQTFVALGKARPAIFFSIFRKVIIVVPLTLLLPSFFGIDGVMLAEPISNIVGGLAAYLTMRHIVMPELRSMDR